MRILHTSDWHLGRALHGQSLQSAQEAFFDHLVDVVTAESVDLLVVAGDVYDRALPPVPAVSLLDEALDRLLATGVQILMTAGNHDSAQRLGFGARRMARAGLHLRTGLADAATPVVLEDRHGPLNCYGIGYLEPAVVSEQLGVSRSHESVLARVMEGIRDDLAGRAGGRSLVAAHAFVAGGQPSDSERDIRVGGVDRVPVSVFDGVTYTALGHLHRPQEVTPYARYSGSPVAYSFSEAGHAKGSWLVEIGEQAATRVDFVPAPVSTPLVRLSGRLAELLTDPQYRHAESAYCQIELTDGERPRAPMERLRSRFPQTLSLSFRPEMSRPAGGVTGVQARTGLGDEELCCAFFDSVRGHGVSAEERRLVQQAVEAARLVEAAG